MHEDILRLTAYTKSSFFAPSYPVLHLHLLFQECTSHVVDAFCAVSLQPCGFKDCSPIDTRCARGAMVAWADCLEMSMTGGSCNSLHYYTIYYYTTTLLRD